MEKTYIISDIHLGSDACEAKLLNIFLEDLEEKCDRLILNGDVFESIDFRRLKKSHWHVLSTLRKLSNKIKIIWVCGNHDGAAEIISHLLGVEVYENYQFTSGNKKILVLHGHIFDEFLDAHPILTWIGDFIYNILQRIDKSHNIARFAKHSSKQYQRCTDIIKEGATKLAQKKGCDVVCCGHTHDATADLTKEIAYYNSGCWTEKPCTYIEIIDDEIKILTTNDLESA